MLRREPSRHPTSVPDLELGIAVTLLLIGIVLTAFFVPGLS
ncbi:hypothetical protein BH23CHL9_BH23CHL9_06590 [soil metagenome]